MIIKLKLFNRIWKVNIKPWCVFWPFMTLSIKCHVFTLVNRVVQLKESICTYFNLECQCLDASIPMCYQVEEFFSNVYIIKRFSSKVIHDINPLNKLFFQILNYHFLKALVVVAFIILINTQLISLKQIPYHGCHFTGRLYINREVSFDVYIFPFQLKNLYLYFFLQSNHLKQYCLF